jgi:hypothetical protein
MTETRMTKKMKKSLIVSQITSVDYPLWRAWLAKYHSWFDEILIYFDVQYRHPFFWAFIQQNLSTIPNIRFLDPVPYEYGVGDWRSTATNELVKQATGDWLISIEQDWFVIDWEALFKNMSGSMSVADMFGWWNPTNTPYIHPAFWGIKRELFEKTTKDFSPHPEINGSDHFAMVTYDAIKLGAKIDKYYEKFSPDSNYFHLGGVNQNYLNGMNEGFEFHRAEPFYVYNKHCMSLPIAQDERFMNLMGDINMKLYKTFTEPWPIYDDRWGKFFII